METQSSIFAWEISGREEPGRLQSMGHKKSDTTKHSHTHTAYSGASLVAQIVNKLLQWKRCKRCGFNPWVRKIPWRRKWKPTPVFLPGTSHGTEETGGLQSTGCKESDMTEQLSRSLLKALYYMLGIQ